MEIKRDPYKAWQKVKDIPGGAMSKRERLRRAKEKRFRISDRRRRKGNKNKARSSDKKAQEKFDGRDIYLAGHTITPRALCFRDLVPNISGAEHYLQDLARKFGEGVASDDGDDSDGDGDGDSPVRVSFAKTEHWRPLLYTNPPGVSLNRLELKKHMR